MVYFELFKPTESRMKRVISYGMYKVSEFLYITCIKTREIFLLDVSEKLQIKLSNSNQASGQILNLLHETQFEIKLFN